MKILVKFSYFILLDKNSGKGALSLGELECVVDLLSDCNKLI